MHTIISHTYVFTNVPHGQISQRDYTLSVTTTEAA
jgi:hypothetical protein